MRSVIEALGWEGKIAYTAPTGVAACNIRGLTIHSWAGVGKASESIEDLLPIVARNSGACKRWKDVEILVIDEISMLSAELFDKLDMIGRRVRNKMDPFGGIQVIVCGDFFQLPPIGLGKSVKFCFEAEAWKELFEKDSSDGMIILDKVYRQQDDTTFLNLLNEMREGVISGRNQQILLQKVKEAQELYNQQSHSFAPASKQLQSKKLEIRPTKLFSTNHDVDQFNMTELERLSMSSDDMDDDKDPIIYFARDDGREPYLSQLKAGTKAPEKLHLKRGAQVMLLKNLDTENGLVNGARGTVVDFERSSGRTDFCPMLPVVNFSVVVGSIRREERVVLTPEVWEVKLGEKVLASRKQIPLMLAWAISIHKSQGMTIPLLEVSFNRMFEFGQAYVALSRATSLDGLTLNSFQANSIRAHPLVIHFYRNIADRQRQRYREQSHNVDEIVEVSLQSFVDEFNTNRVVKQVDRDEWIETRPRPISSSNRNQSFVNDATEISQPFGQQQVGNEVLQKEESVRSEAELDTVSEIVAPAQDITGKKPSMLFNNRIVVESTCNPTKPLDFQDASRSNAFGDEWLHEDFMARKRSESRQRIAASNAGFHPLALRGSEGSPVTQLLTAIQPQPQQQPQQQQQQAQSASSSLTTNKEIDSWDVVDLVHSASDEDNDVNDDETVLLPISKATLSVLSSTEQEPVQARTQSSKDFGGYGESPHFSENRNPLDRVLSQGSGTPSANITVKSDPHAESDSNKQGKMIITDSLKRKLEENRQKALEKLEMFKKSRLNESTISL